MLVCDAGHPLVSQGRLREELLLYNISDENSALLTDRFYEITGRELSLQSETDCLSGGQKVLLMFLLALYSPARQLHFIGLWHSLDTLVATRVRTLCEDFAKVKKLTFEDAHLAR